MAPFLPLLSYIITIDLQHDRWFGHFTLSRLCILHPSCSAGSTPHPHTLSLRSQHTVCIIRVYALSHYASAVSLQWFHPIRLGYKYHVYPLVSRPDLNTMILLHLWDLNTIVLLSLPSLWTRSYYTIVVCSILSRAYHPILVCSTTTSGTLPFFYEGHSAPSGFQSMLVEL